MTSRALRSLLVATALLASPATNAIDLAGSLGGSGSRFDTFTPDRDSSDRLNLDAGLWGRGYVLSPEDVDWTGSVHYGRNRQGTSSSTADGNLLTYDASAGLFDNRRSQLALRFGGSRSQSDLTTSSAGTTFTGTNLSTGASADLRAGGHGGYPTLSVRGSWMDVTNSGLDREDMRTITRDLAASAAHGGENYNYRLSYDVRTSAGTVPALDYDTQTLGFLGSGQAADNTSLGFYGQHFTRAPRISDGTNPKYDDTIAGASSSTSTSAFRLGTRYDFSHFLFESAAVPATERYHHTFSLSADRPLGPEWGIVPTASASYAQDRVGTEEATSAGQSVGTALRYAPKLRSGGAYFDASGRVGLLEPSEGATQVGWGAGGSGRYENMWGATAYNASYRVDYDTAMNAIEGWTLNQGLAAGISRQLARSLSFTSELSASAARTSSPLMGDTANRSIQFSATLSRTSSRVGLLAALVDGTGAALASPVRGDALFLSPAFQTHSRSVSVVGATSFWRSWTASGAVKFASTSGPDVPTAEEIVLTARLGLAVGQFTLTLEDTYRAAGTSSLEYRANQFLITFARSFRLL